MSPVCVLMGLALAWIPGFGPFMLCACLFTALVSPLLFSVFGAVLAAPRPGPPAPPIDRALGITIGMAMIAAVLWGIAALPW